MGRACSARSQGTGTRRHRPEREDTLNEIDLIKYDHFGAMTNREVILLIRSGYGWDVGHWTKDSVAPTSNYDTPQEAAARAMQLMDITEPVVPQTWPEIAQIGGPPSPPPPKPTR